MFPPFASRAGVRQREYPPQVHCAPPERRNPSQTFALGAKHNAAVYHKGVSSGIELRRRTGGANCRAHPFGFLVMIVVSLLDKEPSQEIQTFVDEIRKPRGKTVLHEKV
jgi:hypothetical protein